MTDKIQTIDSKLKFYSLLQANEKVSLNPLRVSENSFYEAFIRTIFFSSNRTVVLKDIKDTINQSFETLDKEASDVDWRTIPYPLPVGAVTAIPDLDYNKVYTFFNDGEKTSVKVEEY